MNQPGSPLDRLADRLAGELEPVRPQRGREGWAWLALALVMTGAGVHALFGMSLATARLDGGEWFVVGNLLLAVVGLACARAAIAMASPQAAGSRWTSWLVLAACAMPVAAITLALVPGLPPAALGDLHAHWVCAVLGTLSGVLVAAVLVAWLRRGAPASPVRAGLFAGIATGALGSAVYGLSCPVTGFGHWAIWHFMPVLVFALAGRWLLPGFLRW